ncbi:MAG: 5,10-methylenetetrahydrofolate reductase [Acidimicrobiaceae bacterium]|nr:5,10-methylenetetrahydrofolate reductase [Acidimicrobiaceae bacterium]
MAKVVAESVKPTFSVELWPPRSPASEAKLEQTLPILEKLHPTFTSITYGAGGSTREKTHDLVLKIKRETSTEPMAHLTTAAHNKSELVNILQRYLAAGVENILALRGDPPLSGDVALPPGELVYAIELVELARSMGDFSIAVAAHPEGHPDSPDLKTDRIMLARKLELADMAITQFFFDADDYSRLVDDLDRLGVSKPVLPGVMAPTSLKTLERMVLLSGAKIPQKVRRRLDGAGDDVVAIKTIGVEIATELSAELLKRGAPGIHVYTMNDASTTVEICKSLGLG